MAMQSLMAMLAVSSTNANAKEHGHGKIHPRVKK